MLWAKNYGVSIYGLCIDSINEILMTGSVGGQCTDFGTDTLVSIGGVDIFIAKLDPNGNPLRARSIGGTDNDEGKVVKCSETGSIYLAGNLFSPYIVINTDTFYNPGITQQICTITMKLDTAFNILWHDEFATLWNVSNDIALGMKDELYLLAQGPYYSFVSDLFLLKYDTLGNLQWVKVSFLSEGAGVACDISKKGALVVTGGFRPPVDLDGFYLPSFTNPSYYPENFFLAKLDTLCGIPASLNHAEICSGDSTTLTVSGIGNYLWSTGDTTASITVSPAVTSTYTVTVANDSCRGVASSPVWVHPKPLTPLVHLSGDTLFSDTPDGNQWYKESGGIISGATDSVYMPGTPGYYYVIVTNEYGCISDSSNHVYFTNVGVSELNKNPYCEIYPNPGSGLFTIKLKNKPISDIKISVFDVMGGLIYEHIFAAGEKLLLNLENLSEGLYTISIQSNELLLTRKIIISN